MLLVGAATSDDCGETSAVGWHGAAGLQMRGFGAAESLRWLSKGGSQHPGRRLGRKQHFLTTRVACCVLLETQRGTVDVGGSRPHLCRGRWPHRRAPRGRERPRPGAQGGRAHLPAACCVSHTCVVARAGPRGGAPHPRQTGSARRLRGDAGAVPARGIDTKQPLLRKATFGPRRELTLPRRRVVPRDSAAAGRKVT